MPRRKETLDERFWRHVSKTDSCWLWTGSKGKKGHGVINHWPDRKSRIVASRASWLLHNGPIPEGMFVCHTCDVGACVNPNHLFIGTQKDNIQDAVKKSRMARGMSTNTNKLTEDQVREIRKYLAYGVTQQSLARNYGVSQVLISTIALRKTWAWLD